MAINTEHSDMMTVVLSRVVECNFAREHYQMGTTAAQMVYRDVSKNRTQLSHQGKLEWLMTACPSNWKHMLFFFNIGNYHYSLGAEQSLAGKPPLLSLYRWRHQRGTCLLTTHLTSADPFAIDHNTNKWNIADAMLELLVADSDTSTRLCAAFPICRKSCMHAS